MSALKQRGLGDTASQLIPSRTSARIGSVLVTEESSLHQSTVWAALRLRADMISTFPVDAFRKVGSVQVEVEKPPVLLSPEGGRATLRQFLYKTQFDLDRVGNCYGIITATDNAGLPREIQLVDHKTVTVLVSKTTRAVSYRIGTTTYAESEIWHEKQFQVSGLVMGLSPLAHAAWSIGLYQSAQEFGLEWFANGGQIPSGHLQNQLKGLTAAQAQEAAARYKAGVASRDIFVSGNDWEFKTIDSEAKDSQFLETQKDAELAITRFFGVPADLIDVQGNASSVTYANIVQRNMQFLIMNLQPAVTRREEALSTLVPSPRFVKFNTDALLRMDPETKARVNAMLIASKQRVSSEVREKDNLPPFTPAQIAEMEELQLSTVAAPVAPTTSKGEAA